MGDGANAGSITGNLSGFGRVVSRPRPGRMAYDGAIGGSIAIDKGTPAPWRWAARTTPTAARASSAARCWSTAALPRSTVEGVAGGATLGGLDR